VFVWACLLLCAAVAHAQSASDELNAGVQAYKSARYDDAITHFQKAIELNPELAKARFYLATAYMGQYIPGSESPDNVDRAEKALTEYELLVAQDELQDQKLTILRNLASLNFQLKRFDMAAAWYKQILFREPKDGEAFYSLGVIDWMEAYGSDQKLRNELRLKPTDPLPSGKGCARLREENEVQVEDGIGNLRKALELRPDYDDAMAYMNLMYRQRAEYECHDPAARKADLKAADDWVERTMETKKKKAEHDAMNGDKQPEPPH
jgi:tetratricopeptide (TPR) repeat protein